jgi:CTP synthase (UTP-ammonia lyase)
VHLPACACARALLSCCHAVDTRRWDSLKDPVHIVLIGKYTVLSDAYLSVIKALQHACMAAGMKLQLEWVEAQHLEPEAKQEQPDKYQKSWKQVSGVGLRGARGCVC